LRAAIEAAFTDMNRDALKRACAENGGGHSSKRGIY